MPGSASAAARSSDSAAVPNAPGIASDVTDEPGEAAGVDAGDARDAMAHEQRDRGGPRPVVAVAAGQLAHDHAATERGAGLVVVGR